MSLASPFFMNSTSDSMDTIALTVLRTNINHGFQNIAKMLWQDEKDWDAIMNAAHKQKLNMLSLMDIAQYEKEQLEKDEQKKLEQTAEIEQIPVSASALATQAIFLDLGILAISLEHFIGK